MTIPTKMDRLYIDLASRIAQMSHAVRSKVGAVLVLDSNIISYGWNGTPSGDENTCEIELDDGTLQTKPEVLHAESNLLSKLICTGGTGSAGATLYVTLSPCFECAKLIKQAGIKRVVFRDLYRNTDGLTFLQNRGVTVEQFE